MFDEYTTSPVNNQNPKFLNEQAYDLGKHSLKSYEKTDEKGRVTRGRIVFKNGTFYEGQWLNNLRDGSGM